MGLKEKLIQVLSLNVVLWMAMLTLFAGLMFCATGVYMALAGSINPAAAALIVGISLIVIVALAIVALALSARNEKANQSKMLRDNPDNVLEHQLRPMVGDKATDWAKKNTGLALVGALSAGVILAASPRLRSTMTRAVMPMLTRKAVRAFQDFSDNA